MLFALILSAACLAIAHAGTITAVTDAGEIAKILELHNKQRRADNAGLADLTYDAKLAEVAAANAAKLSCDAGRLIHAETKYGENLAGHSSDDRATIIESGVRGWNREKEAYTIGDNSCDKGTIASDGSRIDACGHYTQVVWRETTSVGCAIATGCSGPFNILACNYNPGGNVCGWRPHSRVKGEACTCPSNGATGLQCDADGNPISKTPCQPWSKAWNDKLSSEIKCPGGWCELAVSVKDAGSGSVMASGECPATYFTQDMARKIALGWGWITESMIA
jgi:pathogenesis-related protein 1